MGCRLIPGRKRDWGDCWRRQSQEENRNLKQGKEAIQCVRLLKQTGGKGGEKIQRDRGGPGVDDLGWSQMGES